MLTFAQPLLLLALGGLVIPILIHRISRSRPIPWRFPSISKIRQTPLPRHGSRSLSDLLLLLLRLLLLALLITALAGPLWQESPDRAPAGGSGQQSIVILVDYSSSMAGWNAMGDLETYLSEWRPTSPEEIGWIVYSSGIIERHPLEDGHGSLASLRDFIEENDPLPEAGNPALAIREALALLGPRPNRRVVIVSDFQTTDWSGTLPSIPDNIQVELHRVGTRMRNRNVSIQQVQAVPGESSRIRVIAEAMNYGSEEVLVEAQLELAGQVLMQEMVMAPGILTPVVFELEEPAGAPEAELKLLNGDDPYQRDNSARFSAAPPPPLNVLSLEPGNGLTRESEEIFFIDQALQIASENEWIQFSVLPASAESINPETLTRVAAVIIPSSNVTANSIQWDQLAQFARSGGLVLVTLGDDAVRGIREIEQGGFPAPEYIGLASRDRFTRHHIGPLPDNSPLADIFEGASERDLFLMTIRQYIRLSGPENSRPLLSSESGDPLLIDIPLGEGRLILSAFPWDRAASDFPLRPSFLPIVREVMGMSLASDRQLTEPAYQHALPSAESVPSTVPMQSLDMRLRAGRTAGSAGPAQLPINAEVPSTVDLAPWLLLAALLVWLMESLLAARLIDPSPGERRKA